MKWISNSVANVVLNMVLLVALAETAPTESSDTSEVTLTDPQGIWNYI